AQRASDEALNFLRAAALPSLGRFARGAGQSRARQHSVLTGNPSFAGIAQECGHRFFDRCRAYDARVAHLNQRRALGGRDEVGDDVDGTELIGSAVVAAEDHEIEILAVGARNSSQLSAFKLSASIFASRSLAYWLAACSTVNTSNDSVRSACPARVSRVSPATRMRTRWIPGTFTPSVSTSEFTVSCSGRMPERCWSAKAAFRSMTAAPGATRKMLRMSAAGASGCVAPGCW